MQQTQSNRAIENLKQFFAPSKYAIFYFHSLIQTPVHRKERRKARKKSGWWVGIKSVAR